MTVYCASFGPSGASYVTGNLTLHANNIRPARIIKCEITAAYGAGTLTYYAGGSLSGGSTVTPFPLRGGAPASTQTVKSITPSGTPSGTPTLLTEFIAGSYSMDGPSGTTVFHSGTGSYTFPADFIVTAGDALDMVCGGEGGFVALLYYEELKLARSV